MVARRGLGLITSSNFYVPQVNLPGSMASFVTPAGIPVVPFSGTALAHRGRGLGASVDPVSGLPIDPTTGLPTAPPLLIPDQPILSAVVEYYGAWVIGGILVLALLSRK